MQLHIIAIGNKMPNWVNLAFLEYSKRFPRDFPLMLTEIAAVKRYKNQSIPQIIHEEGQKILTNLSPKSCTIALNERGMLWDTQTLATQIRNFQNKTSEINFLIGGPDGLSPECLTKANMHWSLSPLTLPHPMVRIILIEQLYRAISILNNHPYHRT